MKAGQLIKVLQLVDPNEEVYFSVGYDKEDRKNILEIVGGEPDVFTDMKASSAELSEVRVGEYRLDICLFPSGLIPAEINTFCDNHAKKRAETHQGDNS